MSDPEYRPEGLVGRYKGDLPEYVLATAEMLELYARMIRGGMRPSDLGGMIETFGRAIAGRT